MAAAGAPPLKDLCENLQHNSLTKDDLVGGLGGEQVGDCPNLRHCENGTAAVQTGKLFRVRFFSAAA